VLYSKIAVHAYLKNRKSEEQRTEDDVQKTYSYIQLRTVFLYLDNIFE